jgi:selenocysteine lyase/cysteine desulfurase
MPSRGVAAIVRASPHYYNAEAEIDALLTAVEDIRKA